MPRMPDLRRDQRVTEQRARAASGGRPRPLALPVLFLVIVALVVTRHHQGRGRVDRHPLYYVPVIITLAIISAASGNLGPRPGPCFYTREVV